MNEQLICICRYSIQHFKIVQQETGQTEVMVWDTILFDSKFNCLFSVICHIRQHSKENPFYCFYILGTFHQNNSIQNNSYNFHSRIAFHQNNSNCYNCYTMYYILFHTARIYPDCLLTYLTVSWTARLFLYNRAAFHQNNSNW